MRRGPEPGSGRTTRHPTLPGLRPEVRSGRAILPIRWHAARRRGVDPATDPLVGATIDARYEVISVLPPGEGGMGTVLRRTPTFLNRHFALKVLRSDVASEEPLAERFVQEAQAMARVRHPNSWK